jgi:hypothetical protein
MREELTLFAILSCLALVLGSCDAAEEMGEDTDTAPGQEEPVLTQPAVVQPTNTPPLDPPLTGTKDVEYPPISVYVSPHGSDDNDGRRSFTPKTVPPGTVIC